MVTPLMGSAGGVDGSIGVSNTTLGSIVTTMGELGPTVTFMVDGEVHDVYTVPNGQIKFEDDHYYCDVALPVLAREDWPEGMVSFRGWYINGAVSSPFGVGISFNDDIVVHALFSDTYLVSFRDYDGKIVYTADLTPDQVIYPPPQDILNEIIGPEGHYLEYWYLEGGSPDTRFDLGVAKPTDNLVLLPKFNNLYYVVFISAGDQLEEPVQAVTKGGTISVPTQKINRDGYDFLHWSETEKGEPFNFSTPITQDTLLYAVWQGKPANYTIAIWLEKPNFTGTPTMGNLSHYIYFDTINVTNDFALVSGDIFSKPYAGTNGISSMIPAAHFANATLAGGPNGVLKYADFQGYDVNKEILGNGTTVINMYFSRKVYNFRFNTGANNSFYFASAPSAVYNNGNSYTQSWKYEQDVTNLWPSGLEYTNADTSYYIRFTIGNGQRYQQWNLPSSPNNIVETTALMSKRTVIDFTLLPANGSNTGTLTFTLATTATTPTDFRYYVEVTPGITDPNFGTTIIWNSKEYVEMLQYRQLLTGSTYAKKINGLNPLNDGSPARYARNTNGTIGSPNTGGPISVFYYSRKTFTLTFDYQVPGRANLDVPGVPYQMPLGSGYKPADPVRDGYIFCGWYTNGDCFGDPYDFGATAADVITMPNGNMKFYAKWESDAITVEYFDNVGGIMVDKEGIAIGGYASNHWFWEGTAYPGYGEFIGWYFMVGNKLIPFSYDIKLMTDTILFAQWKTDGFTITYLVGEGSGTPEEDNNIYRIDTQAVAKHGSHLKGDNSTTFYAWSDGKGNLYYPDSRILIYGNVTLTAQYAKPEELVTICYWVGYGDGGVSEAYETILRSTLSGKGSVAAAAPGYDFVNWTFESRDGAVVGTSASFVPQRPAAGWGTSPINYYANFAEKAPITINYEALAGGTVDRAGETLAPATGVAKGSTATAEPGYHFVKWTDETGDTVGTDELFVPAKDINGLNVAATYTAHFAEDDDITINYVSEDTVKGTVSPANESLAPATGVAEGSIATAKPGYHFVNWTNAAGQEVSTSATFVPAKVSGLNVAATYTAHFAEDEDIIINYESEDITKGTVNPDDETLAPATGVAEGSIATAMPGYHFVNWTDEDDQVVGTSATFIPAKDSNGLNVAATYTAHFAEDEDIIINYESEDIIKGTVSPANESLAPATGVAEGSIATAMPGYHFVNWTNAAGQEVSTSATFVPAKVGGLNVAATYTAHFDEDEDITINYESEDITKGTVDPDNETLAPATGVAEGSIATAMPGYHFVNWTDEDDQVVGTSATFVPAKVGGLNVAATYTAHFAEDEDIIINYESEDIVKGTVDPDDETLAPATGVAQGSVATAMPGYHFVNWTNEAGQVVGNDAAFVPEKVNGLNVAATYTAHFAVNDNTVYAVEHYLANVDGTGFTLAATEYFTGTTGALAVYAPSTQYINAGYAFIDSLTAMNPADGTILGNGETVIRLYYSRESYTVSYYYLNNPVPVGASQLPATRTYVFGQLVPIAPDATAAGFTFDGWQNAPIVTDGFFTMPAQNVYIYGSFNYNLYTITVHYQFADGTTAFESVEQIMAFGTYYNIPSPALAGYRRSLMLVDGVMPAQNLEFTVTYTPGGGPIILEDLDTPLAGIGSRNVGDCTE